MNIVFLDAWTTTHGDLSWEPVEKLGHFDFYDRTDPHIIGDKALDAEVVIVNKFPINQQTLACMPNVKYVIVAATGYNNIDRESVEARKIPVSNVRDYSTNSVAQHVFAMLLAIYNKAEHYNAEVKKGRWASSPDFCFYDHSILPLQGKTLGIIGYGAIGNKVAQIGHAFGMHVLATTRDMEKSHPDYVHLVSVQDVISQSDIITLHCALNAATEKLIREETISDMKEGIILINTGRGALLDESDVADALDSGKIAWAALDVLNQEPPALDNRLWGHPRALVTPHIAWAGLQSRQQLIQGIAAHIEAYQSGKIEHRVY